MQLTVLGCNGPYPGQNAPTSGYLLEDGNTRVLLDCGSGVLAQVMATVKQDGLTAVVLSHLHYDHMSDMLPLVFYCQMNGVHLPVYLPMHPSPVLELLRGAFELHDIAEGGQIGSLKMTCMPVRHPVPAYAARYENAQGQALCYTGDTNTCEGLAAFCKDCDLLLADACFTQEQWAENKPHLSAHLASKLALEAKAKKLVLTHFPGMSQALECAEEGQKVYPEAMMAYPGLHVEF